MIQTLEFGQINNTQANQDAFVAAIQAGGGIVSMTAGGAGATGGNIYINPMNFTVAPIDCFVAGTMIQTANGNVAIEDIKAGDMVLTADHGMQAVQWIGSSNVTLSKASKNCPITFAAGSILGNTEDVQFSPNHRVLLKSAIATILFDQRAVLVPAKTLVNDKDVTIDFASKTVQYFHMMFENHEVVFCADGTASESLFVGAESIDGFGAESREEILAFFPELRISNESGMVPASQVLTSLESNVLSSMM